MTARNAKGRPHRGALSHIYSCPLGIVTKQRSAVVASCSRFGSESISCVLGQLARATKLGLAIN